jgi:hypothetical protein
MGTVLSKSLRECLPDTVRPEPIMKRSARSTLSGRVPTPNKLLNNRADARPNRSGRAEDHLGGDHSLSRISTATILSRTRSASSS